jgi:hypothetical protein
MANDNTNIPMKDSMLLHYAPRAAGATIQTDYVLFDKAFLSLL